MNPRAVTHIVVHCSDSTWGDVATIDEWHRARGFDGIGYHYVITNAHPRAGVTDHELDGVVHNGRDPTRAGAHAVGYNARSIGVCLVGRSRFTARQMDALRRVCRELMRRYSIPRENVIGHCETGSTDKTCPNLDMDVLRRSL